jgi:uncharacterized protein YecT (DUF1311 family)
MWTPLRHCGMMAAAVLFAALICSPVLAQNGDELLKRQQALDSVARQKIEAELKEAFDYADKLSPISPVRALATLKTKREQINSELAISDATRKQLVAKIDERIRLVENGGKPEPKPPFAETSAEKQAAIQAQRDRALALTEERLNVKCSIETIATLQKAGNTAQAQKEAEALLKRYPNNPAALAFEQSASMTDRVKEAEALLAQQREGYLLAMRAVDKSAIMPKDVIEFDTVRPGYFKEITQKRKVTLTAREQALLKALDSPIDAQFRNKPFEDVIQSLSSAIGQPILLDKSSLQDAQLESNTPVSLNLPRGTAARTALRKLLQDNGLTYIIKDDAIQVLTLERARHTLITRVYYLGDIVGGLGLPGGAAVWGPFLDNLQLQQNVQQVIDMVKKIDPLSWQDEHGLGTVIYHPPSMSLIVRQTAEFHAKMSGVSGRR